MNESTTKPTKQFSGCANLAALGVQLRQLDVFGPIGKTVRIAQKTVKHTPIDKVYDAFISLLAGAHGLVEINTRLRADPALQKAFGRSSCAEVVQETLDHCRAENVSQMEQASRSACPCLVILYVPVMSASSTHPRLSSSWIASS